MIIDDHDGIIDDHDGITDDHDGINCACWCINYIIGLLVLAKYAAATSIPDPIP